MSAQPLPQPEPAAPVISVAGLEISTTGRGRAGTRLVSDVAFSVNAGEAIAIVGESGSGKSVTALACMGLLPEGLAVTAGSIDVQGRAIVGCGERELRRIRGRDIAMVFQDPMTSLDPCFTIGKQLVESVRAHRDTSTAEARKLAVEMLELVEIPEAASRLSQYPHEFSGGMRQRVMIAGALILRPQILLADEPTTALDVTTQAAILKLVNDLRVELGMAVVWISHDLGVVAQVASQVVVMYSGEVVEASATDALFTAPAHPYTQGLIESATPGDPGTPFGYIGGRVPLPGDWSAGCRFQPRCPHAAPVCESHPRLRELAPGHLHRCARVGEV